MILNIHWKDWCWSWSSNTLAIWCEELTHLKRPWCWERLKAGGEGDNRGADGLMASPTWRMWIWAGSRRWSRTGKAGILQFLGVSKSWTQLSDWTTTSWNFITSTRFVGKNQDPEISSWIYLKVCSTSSPGALGASLNSP